MLWKRVIVGDQERVLVAKNGRFGGILMPGVYRMFVTSDVSLELERHDVRNLVFQSVWDEYLIQERRDLADRYFTRIETSDTQIAMVYVDGKLFNVMLPAKRMLFWRKLADITAEVVDIIAPGKFPRARYPRWNTWARVGCLTLAAGEKPGAKQI